jgi:hypothetical protein
MRIVPSTHEKVVRVHRSGLKRLKNALNRCRLLRVRSPRLPICSLLMPTNRTRLGTAHSAKSHDRSIVSWR